MVSFGRLINMDEFETTHVLVILNQFDLFIKTIDEGHKLSQHFWRFNGDDENIEKMLRFIVNSFFK